MSDDHNIHAVPTAQDKLLADFAQVARFYQALVENASQIAKTRKTLFDAYLVEGFTEQQALDLIKGSLLT